MKTRIISGLIMLPLLVVVAFGGPLLSLACFIIALFGLKELYEALRGSGIRPSFLIGIIFIGLIYIVPWSLLTIFDYIRPAEALLAWVFVATATSFVYMFKLDEKKLADGISMLFGLIYVVLCSYHIMLLDSLSSDYFWADLPRLKIFGEELPIAGQFSIVWLVIISSFGTDIFAYFTGYILGKHKLAPKLSPKKTIEGSVGGVVGSTVLCAIFAYFFMREYLIAIIIMALLGSVVAQIGDLSASLLKRKLNIKDFGTLIPGHGGILDRFDSVILVAPFMYYYVLVVFPLFSII